MSKPILLHVSGDLMLGSAVKAAADAAGLEQRRALSWAAATQQLAGLPAAVVLVDLDLAGFDGPAIVEATSGHVVGIYGPHVRTDLFAAAEAAGIEHRFTRGQIAGQGEAVLNRLCEDVAG